MDLDSEDPRRWFPSACLVDGGGGDTYARSQTACYPARELVMLTSAWMEHSMMCLSTWKSLI